MFAHLHTHPHALLRGLIAAGLLALLTLPGLSEEKVPSAREKEIADVEKQIEALQKKLAELRKAPAPEQPNPAEGTLPADWVKQLNWRCIGPAAMGGRIVALAVNESDPSMWWVATASGGLLKTTNNGVTFAHQFDKEATVGIGDVAVAPSNPNIVWVGTGENNPRNSVSYGDGVYKSTDGGKTWKNMGLKKSFQVGKIIIHPKNPDIVYVGALGRLYGPSEERGLFKTSDGGKTWERVLFVNDKTGVIDMRMNPANPEELIIATWERQRDGHDSHPGNEMPPAEGYDRYDPIKKWGAGSGLWKTPDGGKTWKKLTAGLPSSNLGRVGLDWYRKDPKVVYAVIDCEKIGMGTPPVYLGVQGEDAPGGGAKLTAITNNSPASKAGLKGGDVIKSVNGKEVKGFEKLVEMIDESKAGDKLALKVQRGKETLDLTATLETRPADPGQGRGPAVYLGLRGEPAESGFKVEEVAADGPAAKAGLKRGDIITSVDKAQVKQLREMMERLRDKKPGDKITIALLRGKDKKEFTVTLARRPSGQPGGVGGPTAKRPYSFWYGGQRENVQRQQGPNSHEYGGVYKSTNGGETWTRINSVNPRPMYFSQIRVDPSDDRYLYVLGISLYRSSDGGKTFRGDGNNGVHPDQHALWIDPKDGRHMIVGCDGGFYMTWDRMAHWDFLNHLAIGQFYHCCVDSRRPYRVYGGLQDNGSWGGPSHSLSGGIINEDWVTVLGGDGFVCRVDPTDPDIVYAESQDGNIARRNLRTGEFAAIRPRLKEGQPPYRFNWNTPFILSGHNPRIFYSAGNVVFRSVDRGNDLRVISPEITRTKRGSATALAESPRNPDVLWVGSDDGFLWVTRDGGKEWVNVTKNVGLPKPFWVATIEPSHFEEGRCYVVFDGHRSDDDDPHIYVTEDFGKTWKSLRANLPEGSSRVLREDITNPNLLYLGTEFAAWASLNRGGSWAKINNNLPTVAVHEFAIHPTAGEIVAATHGRSLWVLDVTPLRQMTAEALKAPATLYRPKAAVRWHSEPGRGSMYGTGSRKFVGQNPPGGAQIYYSLTKKADKVSLKVMDFAGKPVRELPAKVEPGLHRVAWDLRAVAEQRPGGGRRPGRQGPQAAAPGMYRVVLTVDGKEHSQGLRVEPDPSLPPDTIAQDDDEENDAEAMEREEMERERGERDRPVDR